MRPFNRVTIAVAAVAFVLLVLASSVAATKRDRVSLADYGIQKAVSTDCARLRSVNAGSQVSVSFAAADVAKAYAGIRALVARHGGAVMSESYYDYKYLGAGSENANVSARFDRQSQDAFIAELGDTVKAAGGLESGYSMTSSSNRYDSAYATCVELLQSVRSNALELHVLTSALKREHDRTRVSLLSRSVSESYASLQSSLSSLNSHFDAHGSPSVTVSISEGSPSKPSPRSQDVE